MSDFRTLDSKMLKIKPWVFKFKCFFVDKIKNSYKNGLEDQVVYKIKTNYKNGTEKWWGSFLCRPYTWTIAYHTSKVKVQPQNLDEINY